MSGANPQNPRGPQGSQGRALTTVGLAEQTREWAARAFPVVAQAYLDFRKTYFHEQEPSLETPPPRTSEVQRTQAGTIAEDTLRVVPKSFRNLPLLRDILGHLQWEVDIHSLTDQERIELHNLTLTYLHGIKGGIQPWYARWVLQVERALQAVDHPDYYLAFPWHAMLYRSPKELAGYASAVESGDVAGIQHEMTRLGDALVEALNDPLGVQPRLCFSGPDGERRRMLFTLKTSAALALGAYLAYDFARDILKPEHSEPPISVIQGWPGETAGQ